MDLRTIAISLPNSPSATPHEIAEALSLSIAALSGSGDIWSAAIVGGLQATVMRSIRDPRAWDSELGDRHPIPHWQPPPQQPRHRPDLSTVEKRNAFYNSDEYRNMTTEEKCWLQGDGFINDYD
ncbi:MAG: hypothetical protein AAGL98_00615 [Planctomycetota bacterium]